MVLDDATRSHILEVIAKALKEDDVVSRALVAHLGHPHLMSLQASTNDTRPKVGRILVLAHLCAALLFAILVFTLLFFCYAKFVIRKRSFKEHYATWQTTQLHVKPKRNEMFAEAVRKQHYFTREEQRRQMQSDEVEGEGEHVEKQE